MEAAAALFLCAATGSKTDHVFLIDTSIWIQVCSTYMCMHRSREINNVSVSPHKSTNSTSGSMLYQSLVVQDGGLVVGKNVQTRTPSPTSKKIATKTGGCLQQPASSTLCYFSSCWILVFSVADTWVFKLLISLTLISAVTEIAGSSCSDCWQSEPP